MWAVVARYSRFFDYLNLKALTSSNLSWICFSFKSPQPTLLARRLYQRNGASLQIEWRNRSGGIVFDREWGNNGATVSDDRGLTFESCAINNRHPGFWPYRSFRRHALGHMREKHFLFTFRQCLRCNARIREANQTADLTRFQSRSSLKSSLLATTKRAGRRVSVGSLNCRPRPRPAGGAPGDNRIHQELNRQRS